MQRAVSGGGHPQPQARRIRYGAGAPTAGAGCVLLSGEQVDAHVVPGMGTKDPVRWALAGGMAYDGVTWPLPLVVAAATAEPCDGGWICWQPGGRRRGLCVARPVTVVGHGRCNTGADEEADTLKVRLSGELLGDGRGAVDGTEPKGVAAAQELPLATPPLEPMPMGKAGPRSPPAPPKSSPPVAGVVVPLAMGDVGRAGSDGDGGRAAISGDGGGDIAEEPAARRCVGTHEVDTVGGANCGVDAPDIDIEVAALEAAVAM